MLPIDYVLVVALLTASPDSPEPIISPVAHARLQSTLQSLCLQWEILDPREVRYILARVEDFPADIKLLRRRYQEMVDAPQVHDCMRFPERAAVAERLSFNRAYRQHLDSIAGVELVHWWELRETVQETDRLYQIWDTIRDARCDYYYVTVRRQALKRLREMLGEEAYFAGSLPPHVPVWRFQKID